jgi:outer membrane lipoprotein-sorting protein
MTHPALYVLVLAQVAAGAPAPTPEVIVQRVLDADPWGLSGATVAAHATLKDKHGATSELAYEARSLRYDPPLAKSLIRFSAPADLAGAAFLQVQRKDGDDERYLFMPDLKKARRISGNLRANAFMGTDFSFADLDRRDLRESRATLKGEEDHGGTRCYHLEAEPTRPDSQYALIELWVRKDNFVPLKWVFYNKARMVVKTLTAHEVRRVKGQWFISRSTMVNQQEGHETELVLTDIQPRNDLPDDDFTVRNLEKL